MSAEVQSYSLLVKGKWIRNQVVKLITMFNRPHDEVEVSSLFEFGSDLFNQ